MTDRPITRDGLRADIAAMLGEAPSVIRDDDDLMDLGLDSMRAMNLVLQWEAAGVPIDLADLAEAMTVARLHAVLVEKGAAA